MFGLLFSLIPGLAGAAATYLAKRADTELQGYTVGTQADTERLKAYVAAHVETNRQKAEASAWWGARAIILMAGVSAAVHFALVMLDSSCPASWGWGLDPRKGGCGLGIPSLPPPYDGYQWAIIQSFFIVMPAVPVLNAVAGWLRRR